MSKKKFTLGKDVALALVEIVSINDNISEEWKKAARELAEREGQE